MDNQIKACIYARCSTEESRQDVEIQLIELRRYCQAYGWQYDEVSEYGSGYKSNNQPKLDEVIKNIRLKRHNVLVVFSVDRFSRQSPSKINALLDTIVEQYKCRFIALQQGIDSDNELTWHVVKPLFTYFANKFSKDLGEKIRKGIVQKKARGVYRGGRPAKKADIDTIKALKAKGLSLRLIAQEINQGKSERKKISYASIGTLLKKHGEKLCGENGSN